MTMRLPVILLLAFLTSIAESPAATKKNPCAAAVVQIPVLSLNKLRFAEPAETQLLGRRPVNNADWHLISGEETWNRFGHGTRPFAEHHQPWPMERGQALAPLDIHETGDNVTISLSRPAVQMGRAVRLPRSQIKLGGTLEFFTQPLEIDTEFSVGLFSVKLAGQGVRQAKSKLIFFAVTREEGLLNLHEVSLAPHLRLLGSALELPSPRSSYGGTQQSRVGFVLWDERNQTLLFREAMLRVDADPDRPTRPRLSLTGMQTWTLGRLPRFDVETASVLPIEESGVVGIVLSARSGPRVLVLDSGDMFGELEVLADVRAGPIQTVVRTVDRFPQWFENSGARKMRLCGQPILAQAG